jgi:hypothetical protein
MKAIISFLSLCALPARLFTLGLALATRSPFPPTIIPIQIRRAPHQRHPIPPARHRHHGDGGGFGQGVHWIGISTSG